MERGKSSKQKNKQTMKAAKSSTAAPKIKAGVGVGVGVDVDVDINGQQLRDKRDSNQYMPINNVARIMRRVLPPQAKIAEDAKESIQECVTEFISLVTTEANRKCHLEYRRTVTPEDMMAAMNTLGFHNYAPTLSAFLNKYRAQQNMDHGSSSHHPPIFGGLGESFLQQNSFAGQQNQAGNPPSNFYEFIQNQK